MATPIIALDLATTRAALELVDRLGDEVGYYKLGSPLFTAAGPDIVRELRARHKRVFLDLKYHDIPNTIAAAVDAAVTLEVDMLTLHASGGLAMMRAARAAAAHSSTRLLGVTVLTSFGADDILDAWGKQVHSVREEVTRLAALVVKAGLHGVVSSPLEIEQLRRHHGTNLLIVTPGIRASGEAADDQVRTATALQAARAGADYLVIGRPVIAAPDPVAAIRRIKAELDGAVTP